MRNFTARRCCGGAQSRTCPSKIEEKGQLRWASNFVTVRSEKMNGLSDIHSKNTILILEDDAKLNEGIRLALKKEGCDFLQCRTIREARTCLSQKEIDLVLLDLNLPDGDGMDFLTEIRNGWDIPIIIVTANNMETDIVMGLELGANDYITKPFSLMVLRARVAVQLRQRKNTGQFIYQEGPFVFDFERMVFQVRGQETEFSKTEQRLLRKLIENKGATLKRSYLIDEVWNGDTEYVDEHALTVTVKRLRDKIEEDSSSPKFIKTVYGIGYTWVIE